MNRHLRFASCLLMAMAIAGCVRAEVHASPAPLTTVRDLPIPGDTSRFDYLSLDAIDPLTNKVVRTLPLSSAKGPHGLYVDAPNRLAFVACEDNDRLLTVDLKSWQVTQDLPVSAGPDVIAFDPGLHRLYVACEDGPLTIFSESGRRLQKLADLSVGDNAHSVAVDPATHRVYLPLKDVGGRPVLRVMTP